jgi:hypothetical protein
MMRVAIMLAVLLPVSAWAQWPTNWPGGDYQGRTRALCVYSAIVERALAAGVSTNGVNPPGTYTQRRRLVEYKRFVFTNLIPVYVNVTLTNAAGQYYRESGGAKTNRATYATNHYVHLWTYDTYSAATGIATSYFTQTPLYDLGTDTNRGWVPMKAALNALVWTRSTNFLAIHEDSYYQQVEPIETPYVITNDCAINYQSFRDMWAAGSNALYGTNASVLAGGIAVYAVGIDKPSGVGGYDWNTYRFMTPLTNAPVWSGANHETRLNAQVQSPFATFDFSTLDDLDGTGYSTMDHVNIEVTNWIPTNAVSQTFSGVTPNYGVSADSNNPVVQGSYDCSYGTFSIHGYNLSYPTWIFRWNVTNGFRYVP